MPDSPRLRAPKVFGILSIIFGALMLLDLANKVAAMLVIGPPSFDGGMFADTPPEFSAFATMFVVLFYASFVTGAFSIALVAIGIGQLRYKRWALVATRAWSVLAVAFVVAQIATVAVLAGTTDPMVSIMLAGLGMTLLPYPILLLGYFARSDVRHAMVR